MRVSPLQLNREPRPRESLDSLVLVATGIFALAFFLLQAWNLKGAGHPVTDEGDYAYAGLLLTEGKRIYEDFFYVHPPLLPGLIGLGLRLTGDMYIVRLVTLALNCLSFVPLFLFLRRITGRPLESGVGIIFYAFYLEMTYYGFRFVGARQVMNILLILFLWLWTAPRPVSKAGMRARLAVQGLLVVLGSLQIFVAMQNLFVLCVGLIFTEKEPARRKHLFLRSLFLGSLSLLTVGLFFATCPGSFDQTVIAHLGAPMRGRLARVMDLVSPESQDVVVTLVGLLGLVLGVLFRPALRPLCVSFLVIVGLVLVPPEYFSHYFVAAAPGFACGAAVFTLVLVDLVPNVALARCVPLALVTMLLARSGPALVREMAHERNEPFRDAVALLAKEAEPVLSFMNPIYAVEAGKRLTMHNYVVAMRPAAILELKFPMQQLDELVQNSCTVFLTPKDRMFFPDGVLKNWKSRFEVVRDDKIVLLRTKNPGCARPD